MRHVTTVVATRKDESVAGSVAVFLQLKTLLDTWFEGGGSASKVKNTATTCVLRTVSNDKNTATLANNCSPPPKSDRRRDRRCLFISIVNISQ
jgi:hypothetical protein